MVKKRVNAEAIKVYNSKRPDGRYDQPFWATYNQLKDHKPLLAYDPKKDAGQMKPWKTKVRRKLKELIGWDKGQQTPEPCCIWKKRRDGYELQKWEAYPEPYAVYSFYMLVPDSLMSSGGKAPLVVCAPGGLGGKELLAGEEQLAPGGYVPFPEHNCQALHYVNAGYVAVALEGGWGCEDPICKEPPEPESRDLYFHVLWMGDSAEAVSVRYKLAVLKWLKELSFVDKNRIAVSAHSMSTPHVLMMALLDPSIKAVVFNDYVASWQERQVAETLPTLGYIHLLPGMIKWFDYHDLMAALAPTPFIVTEGGRTQEIKLVRSAYRKCDAAKNFKAVYYPKYDSPSKRKYDNKALPMELGCMKYLEYANIDAKNHYFKEHLALPWLKGVFGK